eukprot:COSAG06_NODE_5268_length_3597_cov_2.646083_3_plen_143_part_00
MRIPPVLARCLLVALTRCLLACQMELFNDVMDSHYKDSSEISDAGKLQIARAIGVSIVKNGSMYPTLELLLRHAIQYLGLRGTMAVANPGVLDSEADFIAEISTEVSIASHIECTPLAAAIGRLSLLSHTYWICTKNTNYMC